MPYLFGMGTKKVVDALPDPTEVEMLRESIAKLEIKIEAQDQSERILKVLVSMDDTLDSIREYVQDIYSNN